MYKLDTGRLMTSTETRLRFLTDFVVMVLVCFVASVGMAQRASLNGTQQRLLALEGEAKPFISFESTMAGLRLDRLGSALLQSQLVPAQKTAASLVPLAKKLQADALSISGQLYIEPGVELDTMALYRTSAWYLHVYYATWLLILDRVSRATATSSTDTWSTDLLGSSYDQQRLYRILGNQQYEIDQSKP